MKVQFLERGAAQFSILYTQTAFYLTELLVTAQKKLLDVTCTWIIDAYDNQTVWIKIISVGKGAHIRITFGNGNTQIYEKEERELISGTGRTIIEWRLRRTDETTLATLHLSKSLKYHANIIFFQKHIFYQPQISSICEKFMNNTQWEGCCMFVHFPQCWILVSWIIS